MQNYINFDYPNNILYVSWEINSVNKIYRLIWVEHNNETVHKAQGRRSYDSLRYCQVIDLQVY